MPLSLAPSSTPSLPTPMRTLLAFFTAAVVLPAALPAALLAAPFWIVSRGTRRFARAMGPRTVGWRDVIAYDPEIGWRPRPNLDVHVRDLNGDPYHVTTDEDGWRGRGTVRGADVVVFGDSFAFGCAVDDTHHFAHLDPTGRTKAVGAPGYNMVQSLALMESMAEELSGKLVVWLVYPANDLEDNVRPSMMGYRVPFLRRSPRDGSWEVVTSHLRPTPWPFPSHRPNYDTFVDICTPTPFTAHVLAACEHLIERARDLCMTANARLVVMTIPDLSALSERVTKKARARRPRTAGFDPDLPDREIGRSCERLGVPFFALREVLGARHYLDHDVHWNAQGHRRVAATLRSLRSSIEPAISAQVRHHSPATG